MTHEACKSMLRSVVRSFMYPNPGNGMAIEHGLPANLVQELNVVTVLANTCPFRQCRYPHVLDSNCVQGWLRFDP